MKKETRQLPALSTLARMAPESLNEEARTVEIVITTDEPALMGWWSQYYEVLSMDPAHVRMARMESGRAPLLNNHNQRDLSNQIGVIEKAWLVGNELRGLVRFSRRADVEPIFQDVKDGILKNISVGYRVYKYLEVTPELDKLEDKTPTYKAIDWEPMEASLVCVPADGNATVRAVAEGARAESDKHNEVELIFAQSREAISGNQNRNENTQETPVSENQLEDSEMPNTQTAQETVDVAAVEKAAQIAERKRASDIRKAVKAAGLSVEFAEELVEKGVTADEARAAVINKLAENQAQEQAETRSAAPSVEVTRDEIQTRREAMSEALLHRASPGLFQMTEKGRKFQGMSLLRLAAIVVGRGAENMSNSELARRSLNTADFPIILGNVASKSLRKAYDIEQKTFVPWTVKGSLSDYKEMSRIQMGDMGDLDVVPEHGEYQYGSFGEGAEKIKLAKRGKKIKITEEMLINDDLGAMARILVLMGNAAARAESKAVYDVLLNGATTVLMSDNAALFVAGHGNIAASGTTIPNGLAAARAALRKQKTLDGNDFLGLSPKFIIAGPDKEVELLQTLSAQLVATKSTDVNVFANSATPIIENRITGNKWFVVGDPNQCDTVEIAYLDGNDGPQLETFVKDEDDCIVYKVKHVFGVKAIDYRNMFYNPGA